MGDPNIDRIRLNSGFITAAGKESRKDPVYGTKSPSTRSLFFFFGFYRSFGRGRISFLSFLSVHDEISKGERPINRQL